VKSLRRLVMDKKGKGKKRKIRREEERGYNNYYFMNPFFALSVVRE
jgi:hypothetical protein